LIISAAHGSAGTFIF
nr:immunoglobulin light chain junction region [Macaca mulatta]